MSKSMTKNPGGERADAGPVVSDLVLDELLLGLSRDPEATRARVDEDSATRARAAALRVEREAFLRDPRALALGERLQRRSAAGARQASRGPGWLAWGLGLGGAAAVAAALVLVSSTVATHVTPDGISSYTSPAGELTTPQASAPVLRAKGRMAVQAFLRRGDNVSSLGSDDVVRSGDAVGFRVTSTCCLHVVLVGTADAAPVPIVPSDRGEALKIASGRPVDLPASALLDSEGDEERFVIVGCPQPFDADALVGPLESWAGGGESDATDRAVRAVRAAVDPRCELRFLHFRKEPAGSRDG